MKTRTTFKLLGKGVVYCWCGSLWDFAEDINKFIIPILEDCIIAEFNNKQIVVYPHDNTETIFEKFKKILWN